MRARFGWGLTLVVLALAHGAHADLGEGAFSPRERRAIAASGLPTASVVYAKSDLVVAIRGRGTPNPESGVIEGVVLQGEVISDEAERLIGYRSMRSTVSVDCARRRDMVVKMTVFTQPQAKGVAINRHVPGGWVQPSPDAYLAQVIRAFCGPAPQLAVAPSEAAGPPSAKPAPKPAPSKESPAKPRAKPAKSTPAKGTPAGLAEAPPSAPSGPPVPSEEAPMRTAVEARLARPASAPVAQAAVAAPAADSVEVAPQPPLALRPLTPSAVREATAAPAPAPAPKPKPKTAGKVAVQIAAADSDAQARAALAKIKSKVTPPLSTDVRRVVIDGKTFHRALITGFQTRAEAQAFCGRLKGDCFVR